VGGRPLVPPHGVSTRLRGGAYTWVRPYDVYGVPSSNVIATADIMLSSSS